jgi:hypothetical protein
VANNLPGSMQYLDLVRDCIDIFSLEELLPNDVQTANTVGGAEDDEDDYWYAEDDEDEKDSDGLKDSPDQNSLDHNSKNDSNVSNHPDSSSSSDDLEDSSEDSSDDSDDGDYATNPNDRTSRDITLTTYKFAADDHMFHKNHPHCVSRPEIPKKKKKKDQKTEVVSQATVTGSDDEEGV